MLQSIYTHAGCDYGCLYTYSPRHCFNPHTHAGCDNVHNVSGASFPVSIHTPTQGVTQSITSTKLIKIVSIHTPTQGVTLYNLIERAAIAVSIHTPTQGVTMSTESLILLLHGFNPHTHAGCDLDIISTYQFKMGFNPHTHAGCDSISNNIL